MGLISNIVGVIGTSVSSSVRDQYLEFFTSDSLGQDVLVRRGATSIKNGKNKGNSDIISNGSKIAVPEGTALLLVDNGKVVDFTTEAGMYTWDSSSAPSVLSNLDFLDNAKNVVKDTWNRMRMGGELAQQQRIYYVNMLQILNNAFGTPTPLPYHDPEYRNIYIRMNGYFSFRIADPVAFFKSLTGNIGAEYTKLYLMGRPAEPLQPRAEFLDRFSEVLNKCGGVDKIMFANLPSEQKRLREYMQQALDEEWMQARGMLVEMVAINSITPDDKSRERIEQIDQAKNFSSDPNALAAQAILGQTEAMKLAGGNSAGAATGLMGLGMMGAMGGGNQTNAAFGFLGQQQQQAQAGATQAAQSGWTCSCGKAGNTGKFCGECGKPQPVANAGWTCSCGNAGNTGKFCGECGKPQPIASAGCPKCGWKSADGSSPKFCPECGTQL